MASRPLDPTLYRQPLPSPPEDSAADAPASSVYKAIKIPEDQSQSLIAKLELVKGLNSPTIHPPLKVTATPEWDGAVTVGIISSIIDPGGLNNFIAEPASAPKWAPTTPVIILYGVGTGLKLLHAVDCPHGSVSLGNVLLNDALEPLLCDCAVWPSCSARRQAYSTYVLRNKRSRVDRFFSSAPEEATASIPPSKAADVYAFGSLFYMLLKQGAPIANNLTFKNLAEVKNYLNSQKRPPLADVAPVAASLIGRCWAVNPDDRPTIDEVVEIIGKNAANLGFPGVDQAAFAAYVERIGGGEVGAAVPLSKAGYLEKLAGAGSAAAAFFLGGLYEAGDGVKKDTARALELYRQSGEGGSPFGNLHAGLLLRDSDSVSAAKYFSNAAESGNAEALNELGRLTEAGGVDGGATAAAELYGRSALLGNARGGRTTRAVWHRGLVSQPTPRSPLGLKSPVGRRRKLERRVRRRHSHEDWDWPPMGNSKKQQRHSEWQQQREAVMHFSVLGGWQNKVESKRMPRHCIGKQPHEDQLVLRTILVFFWFVQDGNKKVMN
jgi:hypothetical protein